MQTVRIEETPETATDYLPEADRLVAGKPQQRFWPGYESKDGCFSAGIWASEPGTWRVVYTEDECCHLLEGEVVLTGDDGAATTYREGESFVVPAGFTGMWQVVRAARKLYAIYERPA